MNLRGRTIAAEWTWTGRRFERDLAVRVSAGGMIASVEQKNRADVAARLPRRALLPGFVNAHSHAFQRDLRATPHRFGAGAGDFWSWRETMYRLADSLDVDGCYAASRRAFEAMLSAGMTAVGEFHYLHHAGDDASHHWAMDDAVLSAANDAGIRLVLIQTYYATGAIGQPLQGAQRRFGPISHDAFMAQLDRLARILKPLQTLALACHSIRAVELSDLRRYRDIAARNGWPFHVHVEEARREIEDCVAAHGRTPMAALLAENLVDSSLTAIHCTHSTQADLREFVARGGRVCLCPITEGNLSDGFADVPFIRSVGGSICFGTDCNIRLCAAEELRWMEFAQRLRRERRGIIVDAIGDCAPALIDAGTVEGARSLGLSSSAIAPGCAADLLTLNLDHADICDSPIEALPDAFVFGCGNSVIEEVWVDGLLKRGRARE